MSANASTSASAHEGADDASPAWTEPPWMGWIETTGDALLILEAARRGMIPRVTRRLVDSERKMITSGSVFVFDEDESGIKRWTDGFFWSPSRILGNFLLYRETDKKANLRGGAQRAQTMAPSTTSILVSDASHSTGFRNDSSTLSRPKNMDPGDVDRARERSLFGSLTNSKKFKTHGMMKKTFSLSIGGVAQHLISYYKVEDVEQGRLRTPSSLPELAALEISPEYLDKTHFRVPPRVEYDSDGVPRYRGEADEPDSPTLGLGDLPPVPVIESSPTVAAPPKSKRGVMKRYDPYAPTHAKQQQRKRANTVDDAASQDPETAQEQQQQQQQVTATSPVSPAAYDATTAAYFPAYGAVGGYYPVPVPTAYYPPPIPTAYPPPASAPPPAAAAPDPHATYAQAQPHAFYPQPPIYAQPGVPGVYYAQFQQAWRAGGAVDKPAEEVGGGGGGNEQKAGREDEAHK